MFERKYQECGLVDVHQFDNSIVVDLKYGTTENFMGEIMYENSKLAYLEKDLALAIANVNRELKKIDPTLSIIIYDAARPISVQEKMFNYVKGTILEQYVANPNGEVRGGFHNYGLAVDISIVDSDNKMLDMGTGYDSFDELAHVGGESELVKRGKLTYEAYKNRMMLYYITSKHGLLPYPYEWWHYQLCQEERDKLRYKLLDF